MAAANPAAFSGLEFLATAVVVLDGGYVVRYTNQAAENLLGAGAKTLVGQAFPALFTDSRALESLLADALANRLQDAGLGDTVFKNQCDTNGGTERDRVK